MKTNSIYQDWCPVVGYENEYEINRQGVVRSKHKLTEGRIMGQRVDWAGYLSVRLNKPGRKSSTQRIHRLLALAFIANPEGKCCVNHLNGNKLDNSLENLAWATHPENTLHAYQTGLRKLKTKKVIDKCTGDVFESAKEAAAYVNMHYDTVRQYLNGGIKTNPTCLEYVTEAA